MKKIAVEVLPDHIENVAQSKSPILSLSELICSGLDADSDSIEISLKENPLGGLSTIVVKDFGIGLPYIEAEKAFKQLGGSWKQGKKKSRTKSRSLHGQHGQGRFKAFSIGNSVQWEFTYQKEEGTLYRYTVRGYKDRIQEFEISDERKVETTTTGTVVTLDGIQKDFTSLDSRKAIPRLTELFALFLVQYPNVGISYQGEPIDPKSIQKNCDEFPMDEIELDDGSKVAAKLTVIEWLSDQGKTPKPKTLALCDGAGFLLAEIPTGIQPPHSFFTAYLNCGKFKEWHHRLPLAEIDPDIKKLVEPARDWLRQYFEQKATLKTKELVSNRKSREIYPFQGEPADVIERTKRQVFDICAVKINEGLPGFDKFPEASKKFTLHVLKQALEDDPSSLKDIFDSVLKLSKQDQKELAELLQKTSLTSIIHAAKEVAERLDFLQGLETLIFEQNLKQRVKERNQLHRILARNTWVFGETFNLMIDDQSLNAVLKAHLKQLGRDDFEGIEHDPVLIEGKTKGIIDLMLGQAARRGDEVEHLVVELKRPSVKIGPNELQQIENYAFSIIRDQRFDHQKTKWKFLIISNGLTENAKIKLHQGGKPKGLVWDSAEGNCEVWAKTWGEIINDCKSRLQFYQEKLEYEATSFSGLSLLKKAYSKYLPEEVIAMNWGSNLFIDPNQANCCFSQRLHFQFFQMRFHKVLRLVLEYLVYQFARNQKKFVQSLQNSV